MKISHKHKKINISYVIGRLSKQIGKKFQYFPIDNWQKDLVLAKKFGFNGVEWIISDYSNPIFNNFFLKEIKKELKKRKIKITSIALDLIMDEPLHRMSLLNLKWLIKKIILIQNNIKINRINVPIEEHARFRNYIEMKIAIKKLSLILNNLGKKSKISIETDLNPRKLIHLLKSKNLRRLGLLIDLGNIRANGYNLEDYFKYFKEKIYGFHIKFREKNFGKSKKIPIHFKELTIMKKNLLKLNNLEDITFQTFRSHDNFIADMKISIKNYNRIISA